jgi:hypothetical protein
MVDLNEKERRALTGGITVGHLAGLVIDGFATMRLTLAAVGGREQRLVWIKISESGLKAIAE